ncbi:ETS-related transcription factor Elf-3-like [Sinocyclocheilus anshuiensis]|uniref:ETS-related transcription factor Elf-3-like n=1 Tax=Sinocyclocheilus anshuiensis TaxID=1608454 RepID=UPI0007B80A08|nr:PREDICTED: ETS-related transcription factor Elf-3-like [Sinocyclocheilus anshuiensis]
MASSELSLILNNANANLYPSEPQPNLLSMTAPMGRLSEMTFSSNNNSTMGLWDLVNPQMWTRQNVLEWIGFHVEDSRFDASLLNMNYCDMDGITLCTMSKETLMSMFGSMLGERLHHSLETQKARYATDLSETCLSESELDLLDNILQNSFPYMHGPSLGPLLETVVVQPSIPSDNSENNYSYFDEYTNQLTPESDHGYDSLTESFQSSHTGSFLNPSSPESNSSDSDPEYSEMHYSTSTKNFVKQESGEPKKRGRGRPPKCQSEGFDHFIQSKKSKHAPRGTHLWEFIRDILIHPEKNQGLMKWEDRRDGVFKFLKSEAVAQLWGQKYYYKREILERVDGRRLVYKFGKNSTGWRMEETGY